MNDETPPAGLVAGKYKLTRLLGRGGMGSVWEGVHASLGNRVACKFIEPEFLGSADAVTRFENEARAAASLKSKHVVDVHDHGVMPDGRPYIVMEFLEGEPLDSRIEKNGALSLPQVATIVLQVSRALSRAHRVGIVHRDLKPENVFLVWDDEDQTDVVKVVDFGIAKFTDTEASGISSATKTGSILGTPYYMSPEQARGLKNLDSRSDNWSLGVIAYEALTGARPFDGEAVGDLLVKICTADPTPPSHMNPSLPAPIDEWMRRALNRDPHQRFQDVSEMAESLVTLAGLPGRNTLGSAIGNFDETTGVVAGYSAHSSAGTTKAQGSPRATSGTVTHAAMGVDAPFAPPVNKTSPLIFAAAGAALVAVIGTVAVLSGGDEKTADASEEETHSDKAAAEGPSEVEPRKDAPEPEKPAAQVTAEKEAEPSKPTAPQKEAEEPLPVRVATPAPRPTPVTRPSPLPAAASTPRPAPAPAPKPKPSGGGFDLGY